LFLAICPNIGQEEIAKGEAFDSRLNGGFAYFLRNAFDQSDLRKTCISAGA